MEFWIIVVAFVMIISGVSKKKQDELKKRSANGGNSEQTNREQTVMHAPTTFPKQVLNQDINQSQSNIDSEFKMERQMKERQNQVLQQQKRTQEGERLHEKNLNKNRSDRSFKKSPWKKADQMFSQLSDSASGEQQYRARNKREEEIQLQKDRHESKVRRAENDARRFANDQETARKKDILSRASDSVTDDFNVDASATDQKSFMEQVSNLIVKGPSTDLLFDRDFIGEATDMINRYSS